MSKVFPAIVAALILLSACTSPPTREELDSANYGPEPSNYQATVRAYMETRLKDPESARYDFYRTPVKGFSGNPRNFGWVTCFDVNAKNSYGGYTGMQRHFVLIWHDTVQQMISGDGTNGIMDGVVSQACSNF